MEINIFAIVKQIWDAFTASTFFGVLKVVGAFAFIILLIADILLLSKRLQRDVKVAVYGSSAPKLKKSKYEKRWEGIKKNVLEGGVSGGKIAVIEADKMMNEILEKIGHKGKDAGEKIASVKPGQLIGAEEAAAAHELSRKIAEDPSFQVGTEELQGAIDGYEKVFRGLEVLD
jgi:hypothetical protein